MIAAGIYPCFKAGDWYDVKGRGRVAAVSLDRETEDFSHIIDQEIIIDGEIYTGKAVERFAHCPPWHADEKIGILVNE